MSTKNQKIILFLVALIVLILLGGGLVWVANQKGKTARASLSSPESDLVVPETSFDFGTVALGGGKVAHNFELKNPGPLPIRIERVYTSCMCTAAAIIDSLGRERGLFGMPGHGLPSRTNIEINPGELILVKAIFDPAAHGLSGIGFVQRIIYLETNSSKSPKLELGFTAMVSN